MTPLIQFIILVSRQLFQTDFIIRSWQLLSAPLPLSHRRRQQLPTSPPAPGESCRTVGAHSFHYQCGFFNPSKMMLSQRTPVAAFMVNKHTDVIQHTEKIGW